MVEVARVPGAVVRALVPMLALSLASPALAEPTTIVAIGASNTSGWGVGRAAAYPARLEALLKAAGRDVGVVNAGVPFQTTNGMLARIDADVPDGARVAIVQPGGNDLRFLGTRERRAANIGAMVRRLCARGIAAIVYDPVFPPEVYQWDRIHITADGHLRIAQELLPGVLAALDPPRRGTARAGRTTAGLASGCPAPVTPLPSRNRRAAAGRAA